MAPSSAAEIKAELRASALGRRAEVPLATRRAFADRLSALGIAIARDVATVPAVVSAFLPIRGEPDMLPLLASLAAAGYATALPVVMGRGMPLRFRAWRRGEALVRAGFGLEEPPASAPELVPTLLFVPLAAFDRRGYRIGYGGGYYDRTLSALRARGPVHAVGVAFSCQEVAAVPEEPHDARLDALVTECDLIACGG